MEFLLKGVNESKLYKSLRNHTEVHNQRFNIQLIVTISTI